MNKEKYFTIDSDKLIKQLIDDKTIELIGIGSRYDNKFSGLHNDKFKNDNSYNWEITNVNEDDIDCYYTLSNNFEIRETDDILILSKHIGVDIRGGYEDDMIYIKNDRAPFITMIYDRLELAVEDK